MLCIVENCGRKLKARGLCSGHLARLAKYGDVQAAIPLRAQRPAGSSPEEALLRAKRSTEPPPNDLVVACLILPGKAGDGRAYVSDGGKARIAARVAYETWVGPIPGGMNILHRCDVGDCIEPTHLYTGDQAQNMADKINRGRDASPRGEASGVARLTDEAVRDIRRKRMAGFTMPALAIEYEVGVSTIKAVCDFRTWAHVTDEPDVGSAP